MEFKIYRKRNVFSVKARVYFICKSYFVTLPARICVTIKDYLVVKSSLLALVIGIMIIGIIISLVWINANEEGTFNDYLP